MKQPCRKAHQQSSCSAIDTRLAVLWKELSAKLNSYEDKVTGRHKLACTINHLKIISLLPRHYCSIRLFGRCL